MTTPKKATPKKLKQLRDYYDNTDVSDEMERAELVAAPEEILVSTSLRLSTSTLAKVRALAKQAGVPATALMREWIEDRVNSTPDSLIVNVVDLERFISVSARHSV
ncbi:MAG: BrnA antitoxin family protein [Actinomycetia bacterium]|nr:BrnA antitoxin family protein [Actinomycetes bacterium]